MPIFRKLLIEYIISKEIVNSAGENFALSFKKIFEKSLKWKMETIEVKKGMELKFEGWTVEDLPKIAQIEKENFRQFWTQKMLEDSFLLPNLLSLVAKNLQNEVIGYIFGLMSDDSVDIANLAVAKEHTRQKVATQLLQKFELLAREREIHQLFLEVRVSNSAALQLYLKSGFVGKYARLRYYDDGEDALVLQKTVE